MADQIVEWVTNDLISASRLNDYRAYSLHVQPAAAGMVGLKVWGKDGGDTADLFQARTGADVDLFAVEDDGSLRIAVSKLYFDATAGRLGIGTVGPADLIEANILAASSGGMRVGSTSIGTLGSYLNASLGPHFVSHTTATGDSTANFIAVRQMFGAGGLIVQTSPATAAASPRTFTDRLTVEPTNGDVAIHTGKLLTGVDGSDIGTAALRWDVFARELRSYAAASDAEPAILMSGNSILIGPGGATAADVLLSRGAANRLDLGTGDSFNVVNGSILTGTDAADLGTAALRWDLFSSDVRLYNAASDANPSVRLNALSILFGPGGATAPDVGLSRGAANRLDLATGDSFNLVSGDLTIAATFSHVTSTGKLFNSGEFELDGAFNHDGTTVGFYGVTPVVRPSAYTQTYATADKTLGAYTADDESVVYTGQSNTALGATFAKVVDLNALRVAYENLRAFTEDAVAMLNSAVDDLQALGLVT